MPLGERWDEYWEDWHDQYYDGLSQEDQEDWDALASELVDSWNESTGHFDPDIVQEINNWLEDRDYDIEEFWAEYYA